ncbi:MAG: ABC transporter permease [Phycisphaerales bacterium JB038]
MPDFAVVFWKEWRERLQEPGRPINTWQTLVLVMVGGGLWFAFQNGDNATARGPLTGALAGMVLVALSVSDSFAGERERGTLEALFSTPLSDAGILFGKVLAAGTHGWLLGLLFTTSVAAGLALAGTAWAPLWQPTALAGVLVFGFSGALLFAVVGCTVSVRSPSVAIAQQRLMVSVVGTAIGLSALVIGSALLVRRLAGQGGPMANTMARALRWVGTLTPVQGLLVASAVCVLLAVPILLYAEAQVQAARERK